MLTIVLTNQPGGVTGSVKISGLAPGRYKAVALTGEDRKRDHDLSLIGPLLGLADSFEVVAGRSVSVRP